MNRILQDHGFRIHLITYVAVNLLLIAINFAVSPGRLWFYWPLIGWGIGILGHAFAVHRRVSRTAGRAAPPHPPAP